MVILYVLIALAGMILCSFAFALVLGGAVYFVIEVIFPLMNETVDKYCFKEEHK